MSIAPYWPEGVGGPSDPNVGVADADVVANADVRRRYPRPGNRVQFIIRRDATVTAHGYGIFLGRAVFTGELTIWQVVRDDGVTVSLLPIQGDEMRVVG